MENKLEVGAELTPLMITRYMERHRAREQALIKLKDYYKGKHAITTRQMTDGTKPNNRAVNPYAAYITDMFVGYFMGEPVSYTSEEEQFIEVIKDLYNYNDEQSENAELAKDASVYGVAYELLYLDSDKVIRFRKLEPEYCIPIYGNTLDNDLLYFIRYYTNEDIISGNKVQYVEVYSKTDRKLYKNSAGAVELISTELHSFGEVPVIVYGNNEEQLGDFELVLSLIDSYDKIQSDSVNELEYFNDAYLALYGLSGTEEEDISAMKEQRVMLMPIDAKAEWLIKQINDTYVENLKSRIDADIHKFSMCPPMTDEEFASNASGVAMKYKLMGFDNATRKKERHFKKALQRRLEIICNMLRVFGSAYDWRAINITFKRNLPANLLETADVLVKIGDLLSEETKIGMLPMDIDYSAEQVKKEQEMVQGYRDWDMGVGNDELLAEENISGRSEG